MTTQKKHRFAVFLIVNDIEGGGGVERQYTNFILLGQEQNVDIITTRQSRDRILRLHPDFPRHRLKTFPVLNNRLSYFVSCLFLSMHMKLNRYALVHIANFDHYYAPLYRHLARFTRLSLNIIDCRFAPEFSDQRYAGISEFIGSGILSGIFSWYKNAEEVVKRLDKKLLFKAASYCFTNYDNFKQAEKKNVVVFAARLSPIKRADHYLRAVSLCLQKQPQLFASWKFLLWGNGESHDEVTQLIGDLGLAGKIETGFSADMSGIFNSSSIFVSTQMYENFTSLSMLEAMASGNAIVSYNVGQTDFFVKDGVNGLLAKEETPGALADALMQLMQSPTALAAYQAESARFAREVYTVDNFSAEITAFWNKVIAEPARA